jgi:2,5-diamino-6-(ribosylamino)-4(3H)-pyrimidinone 5'-phosphate reductase
VRVVVHVAVSLDGASGGFEADAGTYYELARTFEEDVTLTGADTILAQEAALAEAPRPGPTLGAPLLAVVDSRGRVSAWEALRDCGHWSGVVALRSRSSLVADLEALGGEVVRVDSGGTLNGALLRAGAVDEVSLLVHPVVVGEGRRWWGDAAPAGLSLLAASSVGPGLAWLRYAVSARTSAG